MTGAGRHAGYLAAALLAAVAAGACATAPPSGGAAATIPEGIELVPVRGGTYLQGSDAPSAIAGERPAHPVTVSDFRIGKREVTRSQFRTFVEATGYVTEAERSGGAVDADPAMRAVVHAAGVSWREPGYPAAENDPVTWVTWHDAKAFAGWLAAATGLPFRLPREAEWEFAARERGRALRWAGTGDLRALPRYAWYDATSSGRPHPVGTLKPNALGLHDMSGNVWEWCEDGFAGYAGASAPLVDPAGDPASPYRSLRGGSWRVGPGLVTTTYRNGYRDSYAHSSIGFRVAADAVR